MHVAVARLFTSSGAERCGAAQSADRRAAARSGTERRGAAWSGAAPSAATRELAGRSAPFRTAHEQAVSGKRGALFAVRARGLLLHMPPEIL